jgi:Tfp pilus assembly protein PilF
MPDPGAAAALRSALAALEAGDLATAETMFREVTARDPRQGEAWHVLAQIACRSGRAAEGLSFARQAHALSRRDAEVLNTLGVACGELGRLDEAAQWLRRALKQRPDYADAHYNLGKALAKLGRPAESERALRRALALAPQRLDVANNLGCVLERGGAVEEALALFERALRESPHDEILALNVGTALWAAHGADATGEHYARFLAAHPDSALLHYVFALNLLARGRWREGWREYHWRRRLAGMRLPERPLEALPADLSAKAVLLRGEQGLGDELFFLRFAPLLRRRGASVGFEGSPKLAGLLGAHPLLDRIREPDLTLHVGDLPALLGTEETPPPFPLEADAGRIARWRERLAAAGPPPYIGVTWRAGTAPGSQPEFSSREIDALHKEVPHSLLAAAFEGVACTVLLLQRHPGPGEAGAFARHSRRPSCDLTGLNDDLAEMAAVLALIDDYVAVSNTNVHLRAGYGLSSRVVVPFPSEFRWMDSGSASPWFPGHRVYRQAASKKWDGALEQLTSDLRARWGIAR